MLGYIIRAGIANIAEHAAIGKAGYTLADGHIQADADHGGLQGSEAAWAWASRPSNVTRASPGSWSYAQRELWVRPGAAEPPENARISTMPGAGSSAQTILLANSKVPKYVFPYLL